MRVLYITAAHDQHIMSLGEFQACAKRMYPQLRCASFGSVACLHPAAHVNG